MTNKRANRRVKRIIALAMAATLTMSMSLTALAEVIDNGDGTTTKIETTTTGDAENGTVETTVTIVDSEGNTISAVVDKLETETIVTEDDGNESGQPVIEVEVAPGGKNTESFESEPVKEGDIPTGDDDKEYDYTESTTTEREVSAELAEGEVTESTASGNLLFGSTTKKDNISNQDKIGDKNQSWVEYEGKGKVSFEEGYNIFDEKGNMVLIGDDQQTYHQANQANSGRVYAQLLDSNGNVIMGQGFASNMHTMADEKGNVAIMYKLTPDLAAAMVNYKEVDMESIYGKEGAEVVRSIAERGYWGTDEGLGSVSQMKDEMKASITGDSENGYTFGGVTFATREEAEAVIDSVSDGDAQVATQAALWAQHPELGAEFRASNQEQLAKLNMIYNYLVTPIETQADEEIEESVGSVIEDVKLTVYDKVEDAENNSNDQNNDDVYSTDLSIKMVVTKEGKIEVLNSKGDVLATADIVGTNGESTTVEFKGIQLQENEIIDIRLEHVEKMQAGVYVCAPTGEEAKRLESYYGEGCLAPMIGIREEAVIKTSSYEFTFDVNEDDKTVVKKSKRTTTVTKNEDSEGNNGGNTSNENGNDNTSEETTITVITDEEVPLAGLPLVEVAENEVPLAALPMVEFMDAGVPLAAVPHTGDPSAYLMGLSLVSALGLAFTSRRKKEDR